ncbi:dihydrofolate reductase [Hygrophoropsis aurantiaca]|uniref:Dihydrofolate reductase n=1 Tax=Hygrophoropsis aurantiaca TaxID=72124 RepID=A0ACB8ACA7_9AGAM|nr:dihydrofolate reductase [Hygrophoropsis aurantiaca]
MSSFTIIVAATRTNGIGQNGRLPWRLPKEIAYFARVTSTAPEGSMNAVIMGRNTWESIPQKFRPLPRRINIVISGNQEYPLPSDASSPCYLHNELDSALRWTGGVEKTIHRRFIIGGALLYSECLSPKLLSPSSTPPVNRILLTRIIEPAFEECDVYMPDFLADGGEQPQWTRASHQELEDWVGGAVPTGLQVENGVTYEFQMWVR